MAAAVELLNAVAVDNLNLIDPFELDAGVRTLGDLELHAHLDVAVILLRDQIRSAAGRSVVNDPRARLGHEPLFVLGVDLRRRDFLPMFRRAVPGVDAKRRNHLQRVRGRFRRERGNRGGEQNEGYSQKASHEASHRIVAPGWVDSSTLP